MATVAPQPLLEDIESGRCLPFIGAGFSLNAKTPDGESMPDWRALTSSLAATAEIPDASDGPAVAAEFERRFGRVQLVEAIRRRLLSDVAEPGAAHLALAPLPFDTIYTTNFDLLVEDALFRVRRPFRSLVGELQMPFHGGPSTVNVVKMHGDLRHEEHIIVTSADYATYLRKYPIIATHLAAQLITKTALFIGYSLTDPDFLNIRKILRSRLGRHERMSFVVAFDASAAYMNARLGENLHVINLSTADGPSKDAVLAAFLRDIQTRIDTRKGARLRRERPDLFESLAEGKLGEALTVPAATPVLASSSNVCFVAMPFGPSSEVVYSQVIRPAVEELGLSPLRVDELRSAGPRSEDVRVAIQQARVCVADVSYRNPNVMYEVGLAQALGKPLVLLTSEPLDVVLDLTQYQHVRYSTDDLPDARNRIAAALRASLGRDRLIEARQLLEGGFLQASAAVLGIALEQALSQLLARHGADPRGKASRWSKGLGQLASQAAEMELIDPSEYQELRRLIQIRNSAVHDGPVPNVAELRAAIEALEAFVRRRDLLS